MKLNSCDITSQVWHHTCFSLNRVTGRFVIVEDGSLQWDKTTPEVATWMKDISESMNLFTAGCIYRSTGVKYMSMYGSITDVQVYGRSLSIADMLAYTTCDKVQQGDVISWLSTSWRLTSPFNSTEIEMLDLERDICPRKTHSMLLIPQRMTFNEGLRICKKFSGHLAIYTARQEFDSITRFLSKRANSYSAQCSVEVREEKREVQTYLAGRDSQQEGDWRAIEEDLPIEYLPWAANRPYNDGDQYNCLMLQVTTYILKNRFNNFVVDGIDSLRWASSN